MTSMPLQVMVFIIGMSSRKIDHALHNEEACLFIDSSRRFPDWVVITAFYSALHFVDVKLFPDRYPIPNGRTKIFFSLDDYYQRMTKVQRRSRHDLRLQLTKDNLREIGSLYECLLHQSFTFRYETFDADQSDADTAIRSLEAIKSFCLN